MRPPELTMDIDLTPTQNKIGEALNLQQVNILEIEYLKQDMEESKEIIPERLKKPLERLLSHSVKTSRILQELSQIEFNSLELAPGSK